MPLWICHRLTMQSFKSTYVLACERMRALIPTLFLNRGGDRSASQGRPLSALSITTVYLLGGSQSAAGPASDSFS